MRIGIDALLLNNRPGYRQSGIARYLDRLLLALPGVLGQDELVTYLDQDVFRDSALNRHPPIPLARPPVRIAWEHLALPVLTRKDRLSVFHGPVNVIPRGLPCPGVVTVHDLAFLRFPEQVPKGRYHYLSAELRSSIKRAAKIIAVSEATKRDLVELLRVTPDRVSVIHLGVDARFRPMSPAQISEFTGRRQIRRPYVLAVGNLEPRKNLPRLLEAFGQVANRIDHDLVLVGAEGWLTGELHRTVSRLKLGDRVKMTGFVAEEELPGWYGAADLFVLPSLYEGFGLPMIEAMACGVPVVASGNSSIPEIAGDAALLIDAERVEMIAGAIVRMVDDTPLAAAFRADGLKRASRFSWLETASKTVQIYREAVG